MWMIVLALLGCAKECEYSARCDGNVLQTCSLGADQVVGSGERETACTGVNPVCVEAEDDVALCARSATAQCDDQRVDRCEGNDVVTCVWGYEVAEDCALFGPDCVVDGGDAVCALAPLMSCEESNYVEHCEGVSVVSCRDGRVEALDCSLLDEPGHCEPLPTGGFACDAD